MTTIIPRQYFAFWIIALFIITNIIPSISSVGFISKVDSNFSITLYVGGSGPGNYSNIQDALDVASDGDTVYVYNGTYYECIDIYDSINLIGEDRTTTILNGSVLNGNGIVLYADGVYISGFSIINNDHHGITNYGWKNITIFDNVIKDNDDGIYIQDSKNMTIKNNTLWSNGIIIFTGSLKDWNTHIIENNTANGKPIRYYKNNENFVVPRDTSQVILANCSNVTIENLNLSDVDLGIDIGYSYNINITGNNITHNNNGMWLYNAHDINIISNEISNNVFGIRTEFINNTNISFNNIISNGYGIEFEYIEFHETSSVTNNRIKSNYYGMRIILCLGNIYVIDNLIESNNFGIITDFYGNNTIIKENIFTNCVRGIKSINCIDNYIFHNSFLNNNNNAWDDWNCIWDNGYPSGGNFWDDYVGSDNDSDGIGDKSYNISGGSNKDNYPLMYPYGLISDLKLNWNFFSLPTNLSVSTSEVIIFYNDTFITWKEAIDNGIIVQFIFGWNRTTQSYQFDDTIIPGCGYWIYAYEDCELWTFIYERNFDDYIADVKSGWNIVGTSFDYPIIKNLDIIIQYSGVKYSWSDAVAMGLISDFLFGWNQTGQSYVFSNTLYSGYAYWLYANYACTLKRN